MTLEQKIAKANSIDYLGQDNTVIALICLLSKYRDSNKRVSEVVRRVGASQFRFNF